MKTVKKYKTFKEAQKNKLCLMSRCDPFGSLCQCYFGIEPVQLSIGTGSKSKKKNRKREKGEIPVKNCKENTGKNNCRWKEEIIDINHKNLVFFSVLC